MDMDLTSWDPTTPPPRDKNGNIKFPAMCRISVISTLDAPKHLWHLLEGIVVGLCSPVQLNVQTGGLAEHCLDSTMVELLQSNVLPGAHRSILYLGDATGIKGRSFEESKTGLIFMSMIARYIGVKNPTLHLWDWHPMVGHASNIAQVTKAEVAQTKQAIQDTDLVICIFGVTVSATNSWIYLMDSDMGVQLPVLAEIQFFQPFMASINGITRVLILVPHIGVMNHVGDLNWIKQSFADAIPLLLMLGTFSQRVKATATFSISTAATQIFHRFNSSPICKTFASNLQYASIRSLWDGKVVRWVQRALDKGVPWANILPLVANETDRAIIWSLDINDSDRTRVFIPKLSNPEHATSKANVAAYLAVPNPEGIPERVVEFIISHQYRSENEDYYAQVHLNPVTLHLQIINADNGELVASRCGTIASIPRPHWRFSRSLKGSSIEAHARTLGIWRPLSPEEQRELDHFETSVEANGDNTWTKLRLVHTLDKNKVKHEVKTGGPHLHPASASYKFSFSQDDGTFKKLHKPGRPVFQWKIGDFYDEDQNRHVPEEVKFVAPIVDRFPNNWRLLLFDCTRASGYTPVYLGMTRSFQPSRRSNKPYPMLNGGANLDLFKVCFTTYFAGVY